MGKGNRNRQNREVEEQIEIVNAAPAKKKKTRVRKPLSPKVKSIIAYAITIVLLLGALVGILAGAGTFKRANIVVKSQSGDYNLNQQMATYILWNRAYSQAYNEWSNLSSSEQTSISNQINGGTELTASQYALYAASTMIQNTLKSSFESAESTLRSYVAVCDIAEELGITVSKDEYKQAMSEVQEQFEYMASYSGYSVKAYLRTTIGNNVKMKDIKKATKIELLYSKVMESEMSRIESLVEEKNLTDYREAHPEYFYSTDYISYVIGENEEALKAELLAATDAKSFKTILANHSFEKNFNTAFNKFTAQSKANDLQTALKDALKDKTAVEDFDAAITAEKDAETPKLTADDAVASVTKGQEGLDAKVSDWIFASSRKAFDTTVVTTDDAYFVVALRTKPENDTAEALIKKYDKMKDTDSFEGDADFKANLQSTILVDLELEEKQDGKTYYDTAEETSTIGKIKAEIQTAIEKLIDKKNEPYQAEPEALSYQDWMFDKDTIDAPADAVAGKVKEFSKTEGEGDNAKTTVTVYCILEAMKINTDPLVDGGYLKFDKESHATEAKDFYDTLAGLTGSDLSDKFRANSTAVVSTVLSETSLEKETELSAWLFSADRKENDVEIISADGKTYVAFFNDSTPTWEVLAENGYINETITNWLDEISADYELKGMKWVKDKVDLTEQA